MWLSKKKKVLVISIDPAHSLGDSFQQKIGGEIKKLADNLYGLEIDPAKAVEEYKEKFAGAAEKMDMLKGFGLEGAFDIAGLTPGIDEIAAFDKFLRFMASDEYEVIIFDTAPTGHALRFLSLPDVLDSWLGKMITLRLKFAGIAGMFKKLLPFGSDDGMEKFGAEQLEGMKERIKLAKKLLTDKKRTHFWIVAIPEAMSVVESERAYKTLKAANIPVNGVVVNNIVPKNSCSFCKSRRTMQEKNIALLKKSFPRLKQLPLFPHEVGGLQQLEKIGALLYEKGK